MKVYGEDQNQFFTNAGFALFELITEINKIKVKIYLPLTMEEIELEGLMVGRFEGSNVSQGRRGVRTEGWE